MTNLISVDRLKKRLNNQQNNTQIIDVRFQLTDLNAGRKQYLESHLPGAVYLDLNRDLADNPGKHGGQHPIPDSKTFAKKLGNIGIDEDTTVVIYDEGNDMFAARLWWLLDAIGHEKVFILEGGYRRWVEEGNEVTDKIPTLATKDFTGEFNEDKMVDIEQVKEKLSQGVHLVDSRSKVRYLGDEEPLYSMAGHIPGARNYPWEEVLSPEGKWLKGEALQNHFSDLDKEEEVIVSCGSGVSACINALALKAAGFKKITLYPGSFSDWISYEGNEVEIGEKKS